MINWDEVKVGETEIVTPARANEKWLVVCRHEEKVWLYSDGIHQTRHESSLEKWTIYDPWEEISNECSINDYGNIDYHRHTINYMDFESGQYRRDKKGLRVWKRKEG